MDKLFAEFMIEKEYVCGLSKTTLKGYWVTWRTFKRFIKEPTVSRETFLTFVKEAKDYGLQTKTINTMICSFPLPLKVSTYSLMINSPIQS